MIIRGVSVLLIMLRVVCFMFMMWFIFVINVSFFSGRLVLVSVVSRIMNMKLGIFVVFFEVIIIVSVRISCFC